MCDSAMHMPTFSTLFACSILCFAPVCLFYSFPLTDYVLYVHLSESTMHLVFFGSSLYLCGFALILHFVLVIDFDPCVSDLTDFAVLVICSLDCNGMKLRLEPSLQSGTLHFAFIFQFKFILCLTNSHCLCVYCTIVSLKEMLADKGLLARPDI